jgi:glycerophosphoryl diester phosphodiesterase
VLELDVQVTADGRFVVWHGSTLGSACWTARQPGGTPPAERTKAISEWRWPELADRVWVPDPRGVCTVSPPADWKERRLLLLSRLLALFPDAPLNIEMKSSFALEPPEGKGLAGNIRALSEMLAADGGRRPIVVVSASHDIIAAFRRRNGDRWPTNLTPREQVALKFTEPDLQHRVLETTYAELASSRAVVEKVRRLGGHTYVFLTAFWPWPAIDDPPDPATVFAILDRGVDGVMTDRPLAFRRIMDHWIRQRCP